MINYIRPMLGINISDVKTSLRFPFLGSPKVDGIRALFIDGQFVSRSGKYIPNEYLQTVVANKLSKTVGKNLPYITDGELFYDNYNTTQSIVMSDNHVNSHLLRYYIFDVVDRKLPALERYNFLLLKSFIPLINNVFNTNSTELDDEFLILQQFRLHTLDEIIDYTTKQITSGHEGAMLKSCDSYYKHGRASPSDQCLLKYKLFEDMEARIVAVLPYNKSLDNSVKNELGYSQKSHRKETKVEVDAVGSFEVIGLNGPFRNCLFSVGSGLTDQERDDYWINRNTLIDKIITVKYQPFGSKDKPRIPIFKGFRKME